MLFAIHCRDHEDGLPRRLANYEAHKTYLAAASLKTILSGPLVAEDGETMIGSLFIVEAETRQQAVDFNAGDPFAAANVWREVSIEAFLKRVDNREAPIAPVRLMQRVAHEQVAHRKALRQASTVGEGEARRCGRRIGLTPKSSRRQVPSNGGGE